MTNLGIFATHPSILKSLYKPKRQEAMTMSEEKWIVERVPSKRRVRYRCVFDRVHDIDEGIHLGIFSAGKNGRLIAILNYISNESQFTLKMFEGGASTSQLLKVLQKRHGGKEIVLMSSLESNIFSTCPAPTPLLPCYAYPMARTIHVLAALPMDKKEPEGQLLVDMAVRATLVARDDPMWDKFKLRIGSNATLSRMRIWRTPIDSLEIRFWPPIALVSTRFDESDRALAVWSMDGLPLMDGLDRPRITKTPAYGEAMGQRSKILGDMRVMYADYVSGYRVDPQARWKRWKTALGRGLIYEKEAITLSTLVNAPEKQRRSIASLKIQRAWRQAVENPGYSLCRRRLLREFETLNHE
jgi:hypothetical protein